MPKSRKKRARRSPSPARKSAQKLKRQQLSATSGQAKMLLKNMDCFSFDDPIRECCTVNDVLRYWHREATGQKDPNSWNTFQGWKKLGFSVVKGETGFLIWGSKRKMKGTREVETDAGEVTEEEKEYRSFPLCYLFHGGQVQDQNGRQFFPDCPFQRFAMIPAQVEKMLLALPAPLR